jgi:hypothetical protein
LPISDPYEEIYLQKDKWWGLIREEWLSPAGGQRLQWDKFVKNIWLAKDFHQKLSKKYHRNTYVFYGGGSERGSFSKIVWKINKGIAPSGHPSALSPQDVLNLAHKDIRTDGSNNLYVGGEPVITTSYGMSPSASITQTSFWEVRCRGHDSNGDGTVPARSGCAPRHGVPDSILQQFELEGLLHEPAYRDHPIAQQVAYYAVTKLAAIAELS